MHDNDRPLASEGLADAKKLSEQYANLRIDAIYSSPYRRAIQTVKPLATRHGFQSNLPRIFGSAT